jgi:hypothetical protein
MQLILLIGTNPLPNYITALFLQPEVENIFLVHSDDNRNQKGTKNIACSLRDELVNRNFERKRIALIPLADASSAHNIEENLDALLLKHLVRKDVQLNYTGGTKVMAIAVYTWLTEKANTGAVGHIVYSYLDARSNRLTYDKGVRQTSNDLREVMGMDDIAELLRLHGYQQVMCGRQYFPDVISILNDLIKNDVIKDFLEWKNQFRTFFYQDGKIIETKKKLLSNLERRTIQDSIEIFNKSLDSLSFTRSLLKAFPPENQLLDGDGYLWIPNDQATNNDIKNRICVAVEYLDGKWFEHYVFDVIEELAREKGFIKDRQYGLSLNARKPCSKEFDLDIFVLRGYQLIGISITTAGQQECKLKALEVMHRVQQIGGDESRGILIGMLNETQVADMQMDISFFMTGANEEHFKVIGIGNWKKSKLKEELRRFIWQ